MGGCIQGLRLGTDLNATGILIVPVHKTQLRVLCFISCGLHFNPYCFVPIAQPHPKNWTLGQSRSAPPRFAMSPSLAFVFVL